MTTPGAPRRAVDEVALRRCALAVCVLDDVDLMPVTGGFLLRGLPDITVSTAECAQALRDADPDTPLARTRLRRWFALRRAVAGCSLDELAERARPVGLPTGHELHEGPAWARQRVLGGCLDVGLGFVGLERAQPDRVVVVPASVLRAAEIDTEPWWRGAVEYLENMGAMATVRWRRQPKVPLRPMGDCDVVTLLASTVLRGALCADVGGLRPIAVPTRDRGWLELNRIDPAFARVAATLADDEERGFDRPLLLTVDEVTMVPPGGQPAEIVLRDPAAADRTWLRDVLYH